MCCHISLDIYMSLRFKYMYILIYTDLTSIIYGYDDGNGRMKNGQFGHLYEFKTHSCGLPLPRVIYFYVKLCVCLVNVLDRRPRK